MDDSALPSIGVWIKRRRRALDLTQDALAHMVGCSKDLIVKIEGDARRPSREIAARLATHLQLLPAERDAFIRCTRAELAAARLPPPTSSVPQPALVPAPTRVVAPRHNLPAPLASFVGRTRETSELAGLLQQPSQRLITLIGSGGVGKTCLALQVAMAQRAAFLDGVWYVDLAPLRDPTHVALAIAQTLGLSARSGQTAQDCLTDWLRMRHLLLLLDNYEQVVDAAPLTTDLLRAAPDLRVLVTSRVPLRLSGEQEYPVDPLSYPEAGAEISTATVSHYPAVQLFIARARAVLPDFQLTDANAPTVANICARLDGLPLAIELAAARLRMFTPEALLLRLQQELLPMLASGARDVPARQQTMQATIDWSYRLLTPAQQRLFARLGVFVGGWTLEGAEFVCAEQGVEVASTLQALIEQNLVHVSGSSETPRYAMLETVQAFAQQAFQSMGEPAARLRHATYFVQLAEHAEGELQGEYAPRWQRMFDRELDNLRAVVSWSQLQPEHRMYGLRLIAALGDRYFNGRGHLREAQGWIGALLPPDAAHAVATGLRARVLYIAAIAERQYADQQAAKALYQQSLRLFLTVQDVRGAAWVLNHLGYLAENLDDKWSYQSQSLTYARQANDVWGVGWALLGLGHVAVQRQRFDDARGLYEESRSCFQLLRHRWAQGVVGYFLARLHFIQGYSDAARQLFERQLLDWYDMGDDQTQYVFYTHWHLALIALMTQRCEEGQQLAARATAHAALHPIKHFFTTSLQLESRVAYVEGDLVRAHDLAAQALVHAEEDDNAIGRGLVLRLLGVYALGQEQHDTAKRYLAQALQTFLQQNWHLGIPLVLDTIADLAIRLRQYQCATTFLAISTTIQENDRVYDVELDIHRFDSEHQRRVCRTALGDVLFDDTYAKGQVMTQAAAIAEAFAFVTALSPSA